MDLTPWAPLIALGGVALGSFVAFSGQFLTSRTNKSIARVNRASALRSERQVAINDFVEAVHRARVLTSKFPKFGPITEYEEIANELRTVSSEIWFRLGCLEVVCRPGFYEIANEYSRIVVDTTRKTVITGLMSDGEFNLELKPQIVKDSEGKPIIAVGVEPDPEFEKLASAERKFFRAARKELYDADISD